MRVNARSAVVMLLFSSALGAQSGGRIKVGPNVQVSRALLTGMHDEMIINTDPENAARLVACSIYQPDFGLFDLRTVVYASTDGGKTWSEPLLIDSAGIDTTTMRPANSADPGSRVCVRSEWLTALCTTAGIRVLLERWR
jgi:hypothetical protein